MKREVLEPARNAAYTTAPSVTSMPSASVLPVGGKHGEANYQQGAQWERRANKEREQASMKQGK